MQHRAVVKKCPPTACPNKKARDKKWCLLSEEEDKVLKCSPTKSGAEAHEKNVNYFKHATARLTTAAVQRALKRLPHQWRSAALKQALRHGFRPTFVKARGQLWRLL